jgi:hypothetical protein
VKDDISHPYLGIDMIILKNDVKEVGCQDVDWIHLAQN